MTGSRRLSRRDVERLTDLVTSHNIARAVQVDGQRRWVCDGCAQPLEHSNRTDASTELAVHQVEAIAEFVAEVVGEALTRVADTWQWGAWSDVLLPAERNPVANAQRVTDWLRAQAEGAHRDT